jgi:hypothetical protein
MPHQNVITFPTDTEPFIVGVTSHQREYDEVIDAQAQLYYRAICIHIGGGLPWGLLTTGQRNRYREDIRQLVEREDI